METENLETKSLTRKVEKAAQPETHPFLTLQIELDVGDYVEVIQNSNSEYVKSIQAKVDALKAKQTKESTAEATCEATFSAYKTKVSSALANLRAHAKKTILVQ